MKKPFCDQCNDTGYVHALRKKDLLPFIFRCGKCRSWQFKKISTKIQIWGFWLEDEFDRVT